MHKPNECELSIVMPCLNEASTVVICIRKARYFLERNNINGEIVVADNGSNDGSQDLARLSGAKVVQVEEKGYGSALTGGINAAKGKYIIIGDSDDSYDFSALEPFFTKLREGHDLVIGNRFQGDIEPGAMPFLHRYLGNPVLTYLGKMFFGAKIGDFHCGLRAFKRDSILSLRLQTTGMEFASEMIVKATIHKLRIIEVPTTLSSDGRDRPSHLRTWRDGWRHLRFLLIYSPRWLFFYPGLILMIMGVAILSLLSIGQFRIGEVVYDIHSMLYAAFATIIGFQIVLFYLYSKEYALSVGLLPKSHYKGILFGSHTLERGLIIGSILSALGISGSIYSLFFWSSVNFGPLLPEKMMRIVIPSATCVAFGIQLCFSSFFLSILQLNRK